MTVAVYVPGEFLMADTRCTGGYQGLSDQHNKITCVSYYPEKIWLVSSGISVMRSMSEFLIDKHFKEIMKKDTSDRTLAEKLYAFKEELSPLCGENYEAILVFRLHQPVVFHKAYKITEKQVTEIRDFCAIGSGGYFAEGIYLSNPQTLPEDYARLVSQREVSVGPGSTVIKFN